MSILSSLYSSVSGLGAHGKAMDVVSDNLANVNTIGFKAGRGRFEDVLGQSVMQQVTESQTGHGSRLAGVDQIYSQGALLGSGVATDLAITGDGFFITRGNLQGNSGNYYTRNGQFNLDNQGRLVNAQGMVVQGYQADALGNISGAMGDLIIGSNVTSEPRATTTATIGANLNASATAVAAFDPTNPGATSNFATSVKVYDSLGAEHDIDVYFRQTSPGNWEWHALADGDEVVGGTPGGATEIASGTLSFDTSGALTAQSTTASAVDFVGAAPGQAITWSFGDDIASGGTGRAGSTSYAAPNAMSNIQQDGYTAGSLASISVASDGRIMGAFSNGDQRVLGQVALAHFRNNNGLARSGSTMFAATTDSGEPLIGTPGSGGNGSIASGSLEQSNVDMAQEFVNLIQYQRGFQANSRTITTADEMLQDLMNMKR